MPIELAAKYKRCSKCEIFIETEDRDCPCCGMHMRHYRRFRKNREKYKAISIRNTSTVVVQRHEERRNESKRSI
jgi:hypothetical protein